MKSLDQLTQVTNLIDRTSKKFTSLNICVHDFKTGGLKDPDQLDSMVTGVND